MATIQYTIQEGMLSYKVGSSEVSICNFNGGYKRNISLDYYYINVKKKDGSEPEMWWNDGEH